MKIRNRLILLVCVLSAYVFISGCSSQRQPSIVGRWEARFLPDDDYPMAMEAFKNGTIVLQMHDGFVTSHYELKDGTIVVENGELTVTALTKSTIVLTESSGNDAYVFDRVDE